MRILGRVIAGVVTLFSVAAWRRYYSKRPKVTPQTLEKAQQRKSEELAVSGVLRRVAATQQKATTYGTSPAATTTSQPSCDNCGRLLSEAGDDVIYRRFEHGAFNALCSEDCRQQFLKSLQ